MTHIVIVGAGLGGTRAAGELRRAGYGGDVTLFGEEDEYPYDHVPLSKDYLTGTEGHHQLYLNEEGFYADSAIALRRGERVERLDIAGRTVHLGTGETMAYDMLLLATGAGARRLAVPGNDLPGVHYLRTLADAEQLKKALQDAPRVVVIGSGFLGCEIAASARGLGCEVTVLGRSQLPMQGALGTDMARVYRDLHADHGVEILGRTEVVELRGTGRVERVLLGDGREFAADIVVVAVGAVPRVELAEQAGLPINARGIPGLSGDGGVLADKFFATEAPDVFAAGDVASTWDPVLGAHVRREHFASALAGGKAAARAMLGEREPLPAVPFFFTDQYDLWMEYTGYATDGTPPVIRGDVAAREFVAFWLRDDRLVAAMNVGVKGVPEIATELIRAGTPVSATRLADPDVPLPEPQE